MAELLAPSDGQGGNSPLSRLLRLVCTASAAAGGLAIFTASVVVTVSVIMRNLGLNGIRGDFELVELVCTACASLFLPLCQLNKGHVMVDLFTYWMSPRLQRRVDGLWMLLFGIAWALLCWRLTHGLHEMYDYGDRTMLLRAPVWWAYVPAVFGTALSAGVAVLTSLPMISSAFRALEGH